MVRIKACMYLGIVYVTEKLPVCVRRRSQRKRAVRLSRSLDIHHRMVRARTSPRPLELKGAQNKKLKGLQRKLEHPRCCCVPSVLHASASVCFCLSGAVCLSVALSVCVWEGGAFLVLLSGFAFGLKALVSTQGLPDCVSRANCSSH